MAPSRKRKAATAKEAAAVEVPKKRKEAEKKAALAIPDKDIEIANAGAGDSTDDEDDAFNSDDDPALVFGTAAAADDSDEMGRVITHEIRGLSLTKTNESADSADSGPDTVFTEQDDGEQSDSTLGDGESDNEENPDYTVTTDANGNVRYVYKPIEPGYDSDDSDVEQTNTIGSIPLSYYDAFPHIGYDINGKKIMRPAKGKALDALLDSIEIPEGWTGLTDPKTGKPLELSRDELDLVQKVARGKLAVEDGQYDPYEDMSSFFPKTVEVMPLSAAPEPKRRFIPSKHEAKRVMKIVRAIREGRITPPKKAGEEEAPEEDPWAFDAWSSEYTGPNLGRMAAPKLPPPAHDESIHPPPEYIPDETEKKAWLATDPEDREKEYLPSDFASLRKVPGYSRFVNERFDRSLDLYLAPRVRRKRHQFDPDELLPKLPHPDELRPFPTFCANVLTGHGDKVRAAALDPTGSYAASGSDDGTVRIWELATGRQLQRIRLGEPVTAVAWRPGNSAVILAAAAGAHVFFIVPETPTLTPIAAETSRLILDAGFGHAAGKAHESAVGAAARRLTAGTWVRPDPDLMAKGVVLELIVRSPVRAIRFHRRGEYFATVAPKGYSHAVAIHTLSKHHTQLPFKRLKGTAQDAVFHPSKPHFLILTRRSVRVYDLAQQALLKVNKPGSTWASSLDVHPSGNALAVGSFDRKVLWHNNDDSVYPHHSMRFHSQAVQAVRFHPTLPLFADASDDGSCQLFHTTLKSDQHMATTATIVPVKLLRGHKITNHLGVLSCDWHPRLPWFLSAGADGTVRLWT